MTPHNHAKPGDYAEAVLLPGDPLRAKWVAETFLKDAKLVNSVRNCLGYTGTWNGKRVSVQATGMGQPSLSIYVHELINVYGLKTLIRIGTCGGLNAKVKVRDLIIAQAASTDSTIVKDGFGAFNFAPIADYGLLRSAADKADEKGMRYHVGNMLSSDIFYHVEPGMDGYGRLPQPRGHRRRDGVGGALHAGRPLRRQGADRLHHDRLPHHPRRDLAPKTARPRSRTW